METGICILRMIDGEITGWIIADNIDGIRRKAGLAWNKWLVEVLDRTVPPAIGKHSLGNDGEADYVMLVG